MIMEGKLNIYTRIVLTVIAVSLSVIALQDIGAAPAVAQQRQAIEKVIIFSPARNDYCAEVADGYLQVLTKSRVKLCPLHAFFHRGYSDNNVPLRAIDFLGVRRPNPVNAGMLFAIGGEDLASTGHAR